MKRDPLLAIILELFFGYCALPGIGWIYAGFTGTGIMILAGYWAMLIVVALLLFLFTVITLGCGSIAYLFIVPAYAAIPIISAIKLHRRMTMIIVEPQVIPQRPHLHSKELWEYVFGEREQPIIIQKKGMEWWQVVILAVLLAIIMVIFGCILLIALGVIVPPL